MTDKVIITNKTALEQLYKNKYNEVIDSVQRLIEADKKRGIESSLIFIDDKKQMDEFNAIAVTNVSNEKQNKDAVDAVYDAIEPEFILLLGSPDIIPHQHLESPMKEMLEGIYNKNKKSSFKLQDFPCDILKIATDMPYACETPYKKQISEYLDEYKMEGLNSKSRYVGRISGITGDENPESILKPIQTAIELKAKDKKNYLDYFAITTVEPETDYAGVILKKLFNNDKKLVESPPADFSEWSKNHIDAPAHLIVCHGTPNIPYWYGEDSSNSKGKYAVALAPDNINGNIPTNNIAAILCCYGAQLYDPKEKLPEKYVNFLTKIGMKVNDNHEVSLCNTYLQNNTAAFCGSTYFSSDPSILHFFLANLLEGKTAGEAIFDARHQYIQDNPEDMELPFLQTALAGFILLGDPSAQPILYTDDKIVGAQISASRKNRKSDLIAKTENALKANPVIKHQEKLVPGKKAGKQIEKYIKKNKLKAVNIKSYKSSEEDKKVTHVIQGVKKQHKKQLIPRITTRIITEENGKVLSKKTLHSH